MDVQREIESHEQELQALLARVLPMGQLLSEIEAQQARVDELGATIGRLRSQDIPMVLEKSVQAESAAKKVGRMLESLSEVLEDQHGSLSKLVQDHAGSIGHQANQHTEKLVSLSADVRAGQETLVGLLGSLSEQLAEHQRELIPLVGSLASRVADMHTDILNRIASLGDKVLTVSESQRIATERATAGTTMLRSLLVGSLILGSIAVTGIVGLLFVALS